jgi:hypothetical protein
MNTNLKVVFSSGKTFAPLLPCSGSEPEVLKAGLKLQAGEVIDASTMSR